MPFKIFISVLNQFKYNFLLRNIIGFHRVQILRQKMFFGIPELLPYLHIIHSEYSLSCLFL